MTADSATRARVDNGGARFEQVIFSNLMKQQHHEQHRANQMAGADEGGLKLSL